MSKQATLNLGFIVVALPRKIIALGQGFDMKVLITGGAGYIGSHTCIELINSGYDVTIYDNFSNSSPKVINRLGDLLGRPFKVIDGNILDLDHLTRIIIEHECEGVIHFAALKSVGESSQIPLSYYHTNVSGTLCLLKAMEVANIKKIVFSSSATVYGKPNYLPLDEQHPLNALNPYGRTKLMVEDILRDLYASDPEWRISLLRYFNPCGAHESGVIGEDPTGIPNNLMPFIAQLAVGKRDKLNIWGGDYDTADGTGVRDYIHINDLAKGHLAALKYLQKAQGLSTANLGTGRGYSVLEMLEGFSKASGKKLQYTIAPRRPGDVASCYADVSHAKSLYGWEATKTMEDMCRDHWRWQRQNPDGFI